MLTPTKGPLGTQWTAPHSLLLNSLIHSRTNMRSQQACKRLRSYRGEFAARDLRTHDRRARSQPAAHQTRLAESFQRICGSSRASHESKRHEDIAAAACVSSTSRGGAGNQLGSPGISAAREPQEPLSARTRDEVSPLAITLSFPAHLQQPARKQLEGRSHASTALIKPNVEASSASFRKLRFGAGCYTAAAAATAVARFLMLTRQRCLTGNGSPRAAWLFSSFEGACRNVSGRHKLLSRTRGADPSTFIQ